MKTPHRIRIYSQKDVPTYNPVTGEYESGDRDFYWVNCLVNRIPQSKVFEEYGDRSIRVIVCRFMQEQPPFAQAEYNGELYEPIEQLDAPVKGSVRLQRVVE